MERIADCRGQRPSTKALQAGHELQKVKSEQYSARHKMSGRLDDRKGA